MASVFGDSGISRAQVGAILHPGYRSGAFYTMRFGGNPLITTPMSADSWVFFPILIEQPVTIASLAMRVGTSVAGVFGIMALYGNGANISANKPLLATGAAPVDMGVLAGNSVETPLTTPYPAVPGWYWGAANFNGAAQPYTEPNQSGGGGVSRYVGGDVAINIGGASTQYPRMSATGTYAAGAPASLAPVFSSNFRAPIIAWSAA